MKPQLPAIFHLLLTTCLPGVFRMARRSHPSAANSE